MLREDGEQPPRRGKPQVIGGVENKGINRQPTLRYVTFNVFVDGTRRVFIADMKDLPASRC